MHSTTAELQEKPHTKFILTHTHKPANEMMTMQIILLLFVLFLLMNHASDFHFVYVLHDVRSKKQQLNLVYSQVKKKCFANQINTKNFFSFSSLSLYRLYNFIRILGILECVYTMNILFKVKMWKSGCFVNQSSTKIAKKSCNFGNLWICVTIHEILNRRKALWPWNFEFGLEFEWKKTNPKFSKLRLFFAGQL